MLGEKGPVVWEVKHARFYGKHRQDELPGVPHTLIVARNVLDLSEVKYFLSNRLVGSGDVKLEWLLWVACSRFPVERCFELGKRELGMDHFEVRCWQVIHRHLYVSQLSQLFCARVHQDLRKKTTGSLYLTVEQVRTAACAWVTAQALPSSARMTFYRRATKMIGYY